MNKTEQNFLPTDYQKFIHLSRYARWNNKKQRRETWEETVNRYITFWKKRYKNKEIKEKLEECREAILNLEIMPSMRCLMTAGIALEKDEVAGYNCSYLAMDKAFKFSEIMYILMCGTGVGFSVEKQFIEKLPEIAEEFYNTETTLIIPDSKIGWSKSFKELIAMLYSGQIPNWDVSKIRPKGERLKTFGGRASGPEPLEELFNFCVEIFVKAKGRKLISIEVHDIVCKIADIVIVGGVRRSALISLSDLSDLEMQKAKYGNWWDNNGQRALANNSACYSEKPSLSIFLDEFKKLYDSKSGERGIFNRQAALNKINEIGRDPNHKYGTNPCSEILLIDREFCNLTEVIIKTTDIIDDITKKVELTTFLGTIQSTLTKFRFLSTEWQKNCEKERLLGVSLTGICDHPYFSNNDEKVLSDILIKLKNHARKTNLYWSKILKINPAAAITCVKPSGTISQLCDTSSGIHPRYSDYYIRNVRTDKKDPLAAFCINLGIPYTNAPEDENNVYVFSFPIQSPKESLKIKDLDAMKQLKLWKIYADSWCEHKPSQTIYYTDNNFLKVADWVYDNFDSLSGISFLPYDDHIYKHAPYQEITKEEYLQKVKEFPQNIDWSGLQKYESEDCIESYKELACSGNSCEI